MAAVNGEGWCVEAYGAGGWKQLSDTLPTKQEAEHLLNMWGDAPFETRVYEVLNGDQQRKAAACD